MQWLELILALVEMLAIIIASGVAIFGINAWRREHIGKRQAELAEDALAMFYEAADAIRHMRSPMGFGHEMEDVERMEGESETKFEARQKASVVFYRYKQHQELFSRLHASRYRFMTLIGKQESKPFDDIHRLTSTIFSSARMLATLWAKDHYRTDAQREKHWARIGRHEAVFWEGLEDEDPINPKLNQAITDIETICRRVIAGERQLRRFLPRKLWWWRRIS
jgi:hypothetical protein